jgi:ferrochelatase
MSKIGVFLVHFGILPPDSEGKQEEVRSSFLKKLQQFASHKPYYAQFPEALTVEGNYLSPIVKRMCDNLGERYQCFHADLLDTKGWKKCLQQLEKERYQRLIVIPLQPIYSSFIIGSGYKSLFQQMSNWQSFPELSVLDEFWKHPSFLRIMVNQGVKFNMHAYDHICFSYFNIPSSEVAQPESLYKEACHSLSKKIARKLNILEDNYTVVFRDDLVQDGLEPSFKSVLKDLGAKGANRVLCFEPDVLVENFFQALEISDPELEKFTSLEVDWVPAPNDHDFLIEMLEELVLERL